MVFISIRLFKKESGSCGPNFENPRFIYDGGRGGLSTRPSPLLVVLAEVYYSTRWNSAISSWLSVLPGIVADSDRRWAIKVDTLGSFAP